MPDGVAARFVAGWAGSDLSGAVAAVRADDSNRQEPEPLAPCVTVLRFWRILPATAPRGLDLPWRALVWLLDQVLVRRPYRRHGARFGHIVPVVVHGNTREQAVRLGRSVISSAEVLLSILELHEQLDTAGVALPAEVARYNQAGEVLRAHGVTLRAATWAAAEVPMLPGNAEDDLHDVDIRGWQPPRPRPGASSYGRTALTALHSASAAARRAGHPFAGTTHLLLAVLAELNGPGARLLRRLGAQPKRIRSDAGDRLGGPGERGQPATP